MNLTEIFNQQNKKDEMEINFPFREFMGEDIHNNPKLLLTLRNQGKGKASLEGKAEVEFILPCDRCLEPVTVKVKLDFQREVAAPELVTDEEIREEQHFVKDYELNLEELLKEELQINWPGKILCKEGCKGICKKCGRNLNEGTCECDDFVPDVRFANLMDIFKESQNK